MKKMTKTQAKKAVKELRGEFSDLIEIDSETITVWFSLDTYEEAEELVDKLAQRLNAGSVVSSGLKSIIYYKAAPAPMGEYCDPSSRWHY